MFWYTDDNSHAQTHINKLSIFWNFLWTRSSTEAKKMQSTEEKQFTRTNKVVDDLVSLEILMFLWNFKASISTKTDKYSKQY